MTETIEREIRELHDFFVAWFTGRLPATDDAFARAGAALADGFQLVSPSGQLTERAPLLAELRAAHGKRDQFAIQVAGVRARPAAAGLWIATYYEHQTTADGPTRRISTALFADDPAAPCGVRWLHVHETWA